MIEKKKILYLNLFLFLIMFLLSGCSSNNSNAIGDNSNNNNLKDETTSKESETIRIVSFGDSLTQGFGLDRESAYPAILQIELDKKNISTEVFNSGLSGETTTGALQRVDWVLQLNPDIVILTTGANDAFRGIEISIIEQNLREIIEKFQNRNITLILGGMEIVENLGEDYTNNFENLYPSLANEYNIYLIDKFLDGVAGNSSLNLEDEIHPTKEGYEIIVRNNIMPVLLEVIEKEFN